MGAPSNPGWKFGYVPSPGEWNNTFGGKADYPVPVDQGGTGGQSVSAANNNLQQRLLVEGSSTAALQTLTWYGLRTAGGGITLNLPALDSVTDGDWIELLDVDFGAATNPFDVVCAGGDSLSLWGVAGTTATFNISGTRVLIIANRTFWSVSTW